jgi:UDP-N-acetylmuramate--alanine ligase
MVIFQKHEWGVVETGLPGVHNVSNALAAIAAGDSIGLSKESIKDSIATFHGVRRRFELIGEAGGVRLMDDYAHHPTEVRATLTAARTRFPGRRLVVLFQPHTYTRTRYLLDGFRDCFHDCDVLVIARTYAAREEPSAGMTAEELANEITDPPARYIGELDESARAVAEVLEPGDVFFTVGAGDVNEVGPMVLETLKQR